MRREKNRWLEWNTHYRYHSKDTHFRWKIKYSAWRSPKIPKTNLIIEETTANLVSVTNFMLLGRKLNEKWIFQNWENMRLSVTTQILVFSQFDECNSNEFYGSWEKTEWENWFFKTEDMRVWVVTEASYFHKLENWISQSVINLITCTHFDVLFLVLRSEVVKPVPTGRTAA